LESQCGCKDAEGSHKVSGVAHQLVGTVVYYLLFTIGLDTGRGREELVGMHRPGREEGRKQEEQEKDVACQGRYRFSPMVAMVKRRNDNDEKRSDDGYKQGKSHIPLLGSLLQL